MAMGLSPDAANPTKNVVAVIPAACDDCSIQEYMVTDSCRFCLGRPCLSACKFNAIAPGERRMRIDPDKCKSCGQCAKACPQKIDVPKAMRDFGEARKNAPSWADIMAERAAAKKRNSD